MSQTPLEKAVYSVEADFETMKADPKMSFVREAEWALQAICRDDKIREAAEKNLRSVSDAFLNAAAIGVTLNPARKLAYLYPRAGAIIYDLSYLGIVEIAVQDGVIRWAQAKEVFAADTFEEQGIDRAPLHKCNSFAKDRGELLGVYCVAKLPDGDFLTTTMTIAQLDDVRNTSRAKNQATWTTWGDQMRLKSVVKRASKLWKTNCGGSSERLDQAIHYLNTDGGEGLESFATEEGSTSAPSVTMPKPKDAPAPAAEREPGQDDEERDEAPAPAPAPEPAPAPAKDDGPKASPGAIKWLQNTGDALKPAMQEAGIKSLDGLTEAQFKQLRVLIRKAA